MLESVSTNNGWIKRREMNVKRFVLACLAVYAVYHVLSMAVHMGLLGDVYKSLSHVWRPEAEMNSLMWIMCLTSAVWTVLFCYIFTRGYEGKGVGEGARYGLLIGLLIYVDRFVYRFVDRFVYRCLLIVRLLI